MTSLSTRFRGQPRLIKWILLPSNRKFKAGADSVFDPAFVCRFGFFGSLYRGSIVGNFLQKFFQLPEHKIQELLESIEMLGRVVKFIVCWAISNLTTRPNLFLKNLNFGFFCPLEQRESSRRANIIIGCIFDNMDPTMILAIRGFDAVQKAKKPNTQVKNLFKFLHSS